MDGTPADAGVAARSGDAGSGNAADAAPPTDAGRAPAADVPTAETAVGEDGQGAQDTAGGPAAPDAGAPDAVDAAPSEDGAQSADSHSDASAAAGDADGVQGGDALDAGGLADAVDATPGCSQTGCPPDQACVDDVCQDIVCIPGARKCFDSKTLGTCVPTGVQWYTQQCPGAYVCYQGPQDAEPACKPPPANVVLIFDTSGSMSDIIADGTIDPWPACESLDAPATKLGMAKSVFVQALSQPLPSPVRFALAHFPQVEEWDSSPSCDWGYYDGWGTITGDDGSHQTGPGDDWFTAHMHEVIGAPFPADAGDNVDNILKWMDNVEHVGPLAGVDCGDACPGFCKDGACWTHTQPELRPTGSTPIGKTLFYVGEYLRRFVLVEGKPCTQDADCGTPYHECVDGACHDPGAGCRETVLILLTDGDETEYTWDTDYFYPVNQAKRLHMGLGCTMDEDCAPGAACIGGVCLEQNPDSFAGQVLTTPGAGVCVGADTLQACGGGLGSCGQGACATPSNSFADTSDGVDALYGWAGQPLRVRIHVIDTSESGEETNQWIAFWGGGEYLRVQSSDAQGLLQAVSKLTDIKYNLNCATAP